MVLGAGDQDLTTQPNSRQAKAKTSVKSTSGKPPRYIRIVSDSALNPSVSMSSFAAELNPGVSINNAPGWRC